MRQLIECILILVFCLSNTKTLAQADISMATHWYNRANYNPATIARTDYIYLFSNIRQQWTGVDGAPRVFNVQASEYIHHLHSAFGLSLVGEEVGLTKVLNPMLSYAYRISKNQDWAFSMGLSAGAYLRYMDGSLFEAESKIDPAITYLSEKNFQPDANIGFEFQNTNFIFGIS